MGVDLIILATFQAIVLIFALVYLALDRAYALLEWLDTNEPLTPEDL